MSSPRKGQTIKLSRTWVVGDHLDRGGFGQVYEVTAHGDNGVAKFVPKVPESAREFLFAEQSGKNIVPIIDHGEHQDCLVLVMPRADKSLRRHLLEIGGQLTMAEALVILRDILDALVDLDGQVVHRDLKPENVLLLDGHWCLADFGISRYVATSTSPNTHKYSFTREYAAPEQWRLDRATPATDIYAVGIMAYELLAGSQPFVGDEAELRDQHLHSTPPPLADVPTPLAALVEECLCKEPAVRPNAANIRARLERIAMPPASAGLAQLQAAHQAEVLRHRETARQESVAQTEAERRDGMAAGAKGSFLRISNELMEAMEGAAPTVKRTIDGHGGWSLRLNQAELKLMPASQYRGDAMGRQLAFDLIAYATLSLSMPRNRYGWEGRSHSLWFGDIQVEGEFRWFETAFMFGFTQETNSVYPFALSPGGESASAVGPVMGTKQLAWPFTPLVVGELDEFIGRWAAWFALASEGRLTQAASMPERPPGESWRLG